LARVETETMIRSWLLLVYIKRRMIVIKRHRLCDDHFVSRRRSKKNNEVRRCMCVRRTMLRDLCHAWHKHGNIIIHDYVMRSIQ
jgi:hypothetical protein